MDDLIKHEKFEIEVLNQMKSLKLLDPLVFGGGTMLRLCHELDRYSADLDFWLIKDVDQDKYFADCKQGFAKKYKITDDQMKHYSLLLELKSDDYPRRLKIEIRRKKEEWQWEETIAWSSHENIQVLLKCLTPQQSLENKINALKDRNAIRDAYDIEFLLRKGLKLPEMNEDLRKQLLKRIDSFSEQEFKVKLGSILPPDKRQYYIQNRFRFLRSKLELT